MKIEPREQKLLSKIKNSLQLILESSTSHGLPNISRSSSLSIKLMWSFFTVVSAGLCAYMITESIINYFNYEVTTKTRILNEFKSVLPTVTVCNLNYFTSELSIGYINMLSGVKYEGNPIEGRFDVYAKARVDFVNSFKSNKVLLGDSLKKLIIDCQFSMRPCNMSQITYFYHPNYGNCYSVNSGYDQSGLEVPLLESITPGRGAPLKLVLNISVPKSNRFVSPNSGAVVFIHKNTVTPFMSDALTIPPKTETNIGLARTFFKSMPRPYSSCEENTDKPNAFETELYRLIYNNTKGYSQNLCVGLCVQRLIVQECKCYLANFASYFQALPCVNREENLCVSKQYLKFTQSSFIQDVCFKECPLECEGSIYQRTVSTNQFANEEWLSYLQGYNNTDALYFNKTIDPNDLTCLNVYYESLSYVNIEESPTTSFVDLLSNVGGIAGLFLGVSLLSFVEIIEGLMTIVIVIKNHKKVYS